MDAVSRALNFDPLARPYRWLEYATFGQALERCRFHYLPALTGARRALILGDGDGRFLAQLLALNPHLQADVVDISPAMLRVLEKRLTPEARRRITLHQTDARGFIPPGNEYDLVATHFFLDCLFEPEILLLLGRIAPQLAPDALWVVSEFSIPGGRAASWLGKVIVSGLYQSFGWITGLRVRTLPDYAPLLRTAGFVLSEENHRLCGLLVSQLWQYPISPLRQPLATRETPTLKNGVS
jgi:SAM-dependent methyltransferase